MIASIERSRVAALGNGLDVHAFEEYGYDELVVGGDRAEAVLEVMARACRSLGVGSAAVPAEFPLSLADRLRADGIEWPSTEGCSRGGAGSRVRPSWPGSVAPKTAAEAGMRARRNCFARPSAAEDGLLAGGQPVTCERIKEAIREAVGRAGAIAGETLIVSHGAQTASGHEMGSGPIQAGEPVIIDLWPRDPESACFADMTRTFVVGEAPAELRRYHELTRESLARSLAAVRPGAAGREVHRISCEPYEQAGLPTLLSKRPGQVLEEGFYHSLGHGVGLEVHEAPTLGRWSDELVAGDVVTLEPGCYRPGFGGCRLEDLVVVTEDGAEVLTDFPYELEP